MRGLQNAMALMASLRWARSAIDETGTCSTEQASVRVPN
jgi:hypothetical protein